MTPSRPLRSEAEREKRASSRWSGQSQYRLKNIDIGFESPELGKGNRDSIGTTDSTTSEDDQPPPLPVKTREADYCNLPLDSSSSHYEISPLLSNIGYLRSPKSRLHLSLDGAGGIENPAPPPLPPPLPPPSKPNKNPMDSVSKSLDTLNDSKNLQ